MNRPMTIILEQADGTLRPVECARMAVLWQGREVWLQSVGSKQLMIGVDIEEGDTEYANLLLRPMATNLVSLELEMEPIDGCGDMQADEHVHGPDCQHD